MARDYGLIPVLPRSITWAPDLAAYGAAVAALDAAGAPVADHCRGTLPVEASMLEEGWRALVVSLPPGLTHLALHCTAPGEFTAMAPAHAGWRYAEYDLFSRGSVDALFKTHGIEVTSTRALQRRWRDYLARVAPDPRPDGP